MSILLHILSQINAFAMQLQIIENCNVYEYTANLAAQWYECYEQTGKLGLNLPLLLSNHYYHFISYT